MAGLRGPPEYPMKQAHMAKGIHGLPKISPVPTMPNPSMPCGRANPETALQLFWVWPAPGGEGGPAAIFYPLAYPTPYGPAMKYAPGGTLPQ